MYEPTISEPSYPHAHLLEEIMLRLFKDQRTEGWECQPDGDTRSDMWGSARWVTFREPNGREYTLQVQVIRSELGR
jgi:hypothetical protein